MKNFEYRIKKYDGKGFWEGKLDIGDIEREFNEMGRDGWELVSVMDTNEAYGSTKWIVATFKRSSE